jgi:autotransporter strand-loop-strand O-heptosyltransferase
MTKFVTKFEENSAILRIVGDSTDKNTYVVEFYNEDEDIIEYTSNLKVNYWSRLDKTKDKNITIRVILENNLIFERNVNKKFNKVYVKIGSDALGDTIAWIPCVEEFRVKNKVDVVLFTYYNHLFDKAYADIEFTDISNPDDINNVDKKFRIDHGPLLYNVDGKKSPDAWYKSNEKFDNFINDFDYRDYSLQELGKIILNLPKDEVIARVNMEDKKPSIRGKYVVVAIQSTSQMKYWNNPFGWERLFDYLGRNGYKIVLIDKHKIFGIPGNFNKAPKNKYVIDKTGKIPLSDRINDMKHADMMITISSGLAWLAWAVGIPVVMISGFTDPNNEFKSNMVRVHNKTVCNSCWNDKDIIYDSMSWMSCPKNNDFVCSKVIKPKDVIDSVKKLMK